MSDLQILQVVGLIFLLVGLSSLFNKGILKKILENYVENMGLLYLGALVALFGGFLLISFHNVWTGTIPTIVTILGWATFIKGFLLLLFPELSRQLAKKIAKMKWLMTAMPVFMGIFGIMFLYIWFFMQI